MLGEERLVDLNMLLQSPPLKPGIGRWVQEYWALGLAWAQQALEHTTQVVARLAPLLPNNPARLLGPTSPTF